MIDFFRKFRIVNLQVVWDFAMEYLGFCTHCPENDLLTLRCKFWNEWSLFMKIGSYGNVLLWFVEIFSINRHFTGGSCSLIQIRYPWRRGYFFCWYYSTAWIHDVMFRIILCRSVDITIISQVYATSSPHLITQTADMRN